MTPALDTGALLRHRDEHDLFLKEHYASPMPEDAQETFAGLDYYPPDPAWVVAAEFDALAPHKVPITSSNGHVSDYTTVGTITIVLDGHEYRLTVLDDGDGGRFVPFRDATSGDTTYGGGRYVGVEGDGEAIDFNRSANPWCVYDEEFSCPLPPPGNVIAERVEAGEKMWPASA